MDCHKNPTELKLDLWFSTEISSVIGPENTLFTGVCVHISARKWYVLGQWRGYGGGSVPHGPLIHLYAASPTDCCSWKLTSKFNLNSREHFKTKSWVINFYFHLIYLLDNTGQTVLILSGLLSTHTSFTVACNFFFPLVLTLQECVHVCMCARKCVCVLNSQCFL